uniref:Uncharacterized protein n=1 Tax=Meloidogyne incognita TaxID=6306 RepID=A0A914MG38_MELIC
MKIYFHILFFILLLLYSIYASRRNDDRNANSASTWRVLLGQASREDTQNFALGNYSPTNRRPNRHRNNQHEVVGDYPTTAEFGDTMGQNVLDNFNSLAINDNENNSLATNNPRGRRTRRRNNQNNNERLAHANNPTHPGIDDAVTYDVPTLPRGIPPSGSNPIADYHIRNQNINIESLAYTNDPAHEEPHIDDGVIYDVPSPPREGIVQLPGTNNYAYARTQQPPRKYVEYRVSGKNRARVIRV